MARIKKLRDISKEDKPRERMKVKGPRALTDLELMTILIGSGTKGADAKELASRICSIVEDKKREFKVEDLLGVKGVGDATATKIIAAYELGRRNAVVKGSSMPNEILDYTYLKENVGEIRSHRKEHFIIFFLDTRSNEIEKHIVSIGTLNASLVHPREVYERAIVSNAASIMAVHNHPSNICEPSDADLLITKRLYEAGRVLGIELLDHVIVTRDSEYSIRENHDELFE